MKKIKWDYIGACILFGVLCALAMTGFFALCCFILEFHARGWL